MKFALQSLQSQTICYWQNAGFDIKQRGVVHIFTIQPVLICQGECQKYNVRFFSLLNLAVCVNEVSKIQA